MLYRQLIAIVVRLFNPRRALAPCRVVVRKSVPCIVCVLVLSAARLSFATTAYTGVVTPVDNPFDNRGVTGIPRDGNDFFLFENENHQTFYEGYHQDNGPTAGDDTPGITADDTNINFNIFVGQGAPGTLQITEVALRDMNLVIGDFGTTAPFLTRPGSGTVRITGLGAVFNSDFDILASGLNPATFMSVRPRALEGPLDGLDGAQQGFDLYVGRNGIGTLEISVGGRAEIRDAVIVASEAGSVGNVIVDGFDSFLGSSGLGSGGFGDHRGAMIGHLGTGIVTIRNGGTMQSNVLEPGGANTVTVAAVLGGEESDFAGNVLPEQGGTGIVTVTGVGSKWQVGGTLQIGGFNLGTSGVGGGIDFEGDDAFYNSEAGRGTLNVLDGGFVDVNLASSITDPDPTIYTAIGRFGRINLGAGGLINIGGGTVQQARSRNVVLFNDGVIEGSGRIQTGVFDNRYRGEVRVGPGEHLIIDAEAEYTTPAPPPGGPPAVPAAPISPLVNYGVIQVFGTADIKAEIEFDRAPNQPGLNPIQPMRNERVIRPAGRTTC